MQRLGKSAADWFMMKASLQEAAVAAAAVAAAFRLSERRHYRRRLWRKIRLMKHVARWATAVIRSIIGRRKAWKLADDGRLTSSIRSSDKEDSEGERYPSTACEPRTGSII